MSAYETLEHRFRDISHLEHVQAMLFWDEATMMPMGGGPARAEALAALAGVLHERRAAPELGDLLADADASQDGLAPWQRANLHQMRRNWRQATALPADLVTASQLAATTCEQTWRRCRPEQDWATVEPLLKNVIRLNREVAVRLGELEGLAPYEALMDSYEEGLRTAFVEEKFRDLRDFLPGFLDQVLERQARAPGLALEGPFPVERQKGLGMALIKALGFNFEHGRIDVSHHPFCGGVPDDTRITTRYNERDFLSALMAALHETGHALYQQGLPDDWRGQPVGEALGMAMHESQSLLMEMQVCRSKAFLDFAGDSIRNAFDAGTDDPAWSNSNLYKLCTKVERGFIRVDADEVTYPLHIILRFEIERKLCSGEMDVEEIPEAWNEAMRDLLGLSTAGNLRDGCMQDVHWFAGLLGYFPSYTLGALTAAQLFSAARNRVDGLEQLIARGDFRPLLEWLRTHVHGRGRLKTAPELLKDVTGAPLGTEAFKSHLQSRYLAD
ncbi:MAG: peptidase M32 [Gemmatimonas sp. SG8_38_2]|nr:MAG: peptidase M32 [Gemmatimonas sp. SG8_38_2]